MIIKIDENCRIRSDRNNWIVEKLLIYSNRKTRLPVSKWKCEGYCNTLQSAVKWCAELKIRAIKSSNAKQILKEIAELGILITTALNPYKITVDVPATIADKRRYSHAERV